MIEYGILTDRWRVVIGVSLAAMAFGCSDNVGEVSQNREDASVEGGADANDAYVEASESSRSDAPLETGLDAEDSSRDATDAFTDSDDGEGDAPSTASPDSTLADSTADVVDGALADSAPDAVDDAPVDSALDAMDSTVIDSGSDALVDSASDTRDDVPVDSAPDVADSAPDAAGDALVESGSGGTTIGVLNAQSSACGSCAANSQCLDETGAGSNCEQIDPSHRFSQDDHANCLDVLQCVLTSACVADGDVVPCLCGTTNQHDCLHGVTPPTGPCTAAYFKAFGTTDVSAFANDLYDGLVAGGSPGNLVYCLDPSPCSSCFVSP